MIQILTQFMSSQTSEQLTTGEQAIHFMYGAACFRECDLDRPRRSEDILNMYFRGIFAMNKGGRACLMMYIFKISRQLISVKLSRDHRRIIWLKQNRDLEIDSVSIISVLTSKLMTQVSDIRFSNFVTLVVGTQSVSETLVQFNRLKRVSTLESFITS